MRRAARARIATDDSMNPLLAMGLAPTSTPRITRVVAPTGSLRQQYVLSRLAANVEKNRQTLLINLNPLRDGYLPAVRAMGARIVALPGRASAERAGSGPLSYATVAAEGASLTCHPREALDRLIDLVRGRAPLGRLIVIDGCQAIGPRDRPALRTLVELARQRSCEIVAIGTANDDTACLADFAEAPVKLPSKYELDHSRVNADWLLASLSWSPSTAD